MPADSLDAALKQRLRAVLERQEPVTEADLRRLTEEARACELLLAARLARGERRLADLSADAGSSLSEIASTLREVNELHPELDELRALVAQLDERAHALRALWLAS